MVSLFLNICTFGWVQQLDPKPVFYMRLGSNYCGVYGSNYCGWIYFVEQIPLHSFLSAFLLQEDLLSSKTSNYL